MMEIYSKFFYAGRQAVLKQRYHKKSKFVLEQVNILQEKVRNSSYNREKEMLQQIGKFRKRERTWKENGGMIRLHIRFIRRVF